MFRVKEIRDVMAPGRTTCSSFHNSVSRRLQVQGTSMDRDPEERSDRLCGLPQEVCCCPRERRKKEMQEMGHPGRMVLTSRPHGLLSSFSTLTFWSKDADLRGEGRVGGKSSSPGLAIQIPGHHPSGAFFTEDGGLRELRGAADVCQAVRA